MVRAHVRQGCGDSPVEIRSSLVESRRDDGAQLLQKLGHVHAFEDLFAVFVEVLRRELQNTFNDSAQSDIVRVLPNARTIVEVLVNNRCRGRKIAYLHAKRRRQ